MSSAITSRNGRCRLAGRDDVVDRRERAIRPRHLPAARAQRVEGLRRRHLVHEVQADEELRLPGRQLPDGVEIPHLLQECLAHESSSSLIRRVLIDARSSRETERGDPSTQHRQGRSAPSRDTDARAPLQSRRLEAAILDRQAAAGEIEAILLERDAQRLRQVAGATTEVGFVEWPRRPSRAACASAQCRRAARARESAPLPAHPSASVTAFTR